LAALKLTSRLVFQPSFASFSNIFGRRPVILVAIALFLAGAIISGVSNDFTHLLVGRSIQGVGGGGIIALTEVVVTDIVPLRHRGQYFGVFSGMWAIGSVSGPILGGAFSQNVTWVSETLLLHGLKLTNYFIPALDLLHQLSFYWGRSHHGIGLPEAQDDPFLTEGKAPPGRLYWHHYFRC
jgi:MFS family permease